MSSQESTQRSRSAAPHVAELLKEQKRSGKSIAAFARERGIAPWKLYQAGKKRTVKRRPALVEVALSPCGPGDTPLEVVLADGVRIEVRPDFDGATLQRLVGVLRSC